MLTKYHFMNTNYIFPYKKIGEKSGTALQISLSLA